MAGSSSKRVDALISNATFSDGSDSEMNAGHDYQPVYSENVEKALTNLNVVLSNIAGQHEELTRSHQVHTASNEEYTANFIKQQELLGEEMKLLRMEIYHLRKAFNKGMASGARFFRILTGLDCFSNEMSVPKSFCVKYGASIPLTVKLLVRNGYELWLDFDKINEKFKGMLDLFSHFSVVIGQVIPLEYAGGFTFNVTILTTDCAEIEYPMIVHQLQKGKPKHVSLYDGGWSFAHFIKSAQHFVNELDVPLQFVERVGHLIPEKLEFRVSCGNRIVGFFDVKKRKVIGMASIQNMVGRSKWNSLKLLVLKYVMNNSFSITAFDDSFTEMEIETEHLQTANFSNATAFQIVVQPFHLQRYTHGVDVSVLYNNVTGRWNKFDYITANEDSRCWTLQIRKRRDAKRTTIHDGWKTFRADMDLKDGDVCVFRWKNGNVRNFDVEIQRTHVGVP